jgi:hypothetical protein
MFIKAVFGEGLLALADACPLDQDYYPTAGTVQLQPALALTQHRHRVNSLLGDASGSTQITGDIYWEEGYNTRIELSEAANQLRISAVPGAGAGYPCARRDTTRPWCDDILLALNGVYGDGTGGIELRGGRGISVEPDPDNNRIIVRTRIHGAEIECNDE